MRARNVFTGALLAAGSVVGGLLYRRRSARLRERVDLYFGDGSMVSLTGSPDADELLRHARDVLGAARG
ncbi:MAG: hypothetical protein WBB74_02060 [Gaiellaceae bacterium]